MRTTRSAQFRGFAQAEERDASTDGSPLRGTPVVLRDGAGVWIRPWRPSDTRLMVRGFYRLSPTSSYRRFLSASPVLTNQMLHDLTDVDHHDAEAVLAVDERRSEGLGIARYIRTARPDVAEVALTVMDEWQGRGLGALLLEAISARAREEGIRTFTAVMLSENHAMRHLLERLGPLRVIHHDRGTVEAEVPLPGAGASDEPREAAAVTV